VFEDKSSNNYDNDRDDGYKSCESNTPARKNCPIHMRRSRKIREGYIPI